MRASFGGQPILVERNGAYGRPLKGYTFTAWDAETGGTQLTDLEQGGVAVSAFTTSAGDRTLPDGIYGPPDVDSLWLDSGDGTRELVRSTFTAAGLSATYGPLLTVAPANADGQSEGVHIPAPTGDAEMLLDTVNVAPDGVKFFTIIKAAGRITNPLDTYYTYVAGHNGTAIWLATGPTPTGPWTYQQAVITTTTSALLSGHVSSPHAIWWNGQMILYIHGIRDGATPAQQPTVAFTSTDGITFAEAATVTFPTTATTNRFDYKSVSTSYVRVIDAGGYLVAVWQANMDTFNGQTTPPNLSTTSIGWGTSTDGLTWTLARTPLLANLPGETGPFGPSLFKAQGRWVLAAYFPDRDSVDLYTAERLEPGQFIRAGGWFAPPGGGFDWIDCPVTFWDDGTMHLYYGATDSTYAAKGRIRHATIDWSAP